MTPLIQPNRWSCLAASFAMCLDISLEEVFEFLGHDGSEILWPELGDPFRRQSFHPQEMFDLCLQHLVIPVTIEYSPTVVVDGTSYCTMSVESCQERFQDFLQNHTGVLGGTGQTGTPHAVAWDKSKCIDPRGDSYPIDEFNPIVFFALF